MPQIEQRYRLCIDRANHAVAGLSMGDVPTLHLGVPHTEKFACSGAISPGIFGIAAGRPVRQPWIDWRECLDEFAPKLLQ